MAIHGVSRPRNWVFGMLSFCIAAANVFAQTPTTIEVFPHTEPLKLEGDLASQMVEGIDRFLLDKIDAARTKRQKVWQQVDSLPHPYAEQATERLNHILGIRDQRPTVPRVEPVRTIEQEAELGRTDTHRILRVRWPAISNQLGTIHGEGLLMEPTQAGPATNVVVIPDCEQTPEEVVEEFGHLAPAQCRIIIPSLVSRRVQDRGHSQLTNREYLYRSSFVLGRQLTGYELQKIFAIIDWFELKYSEPADAALPSTDSKIAVLGYGEGARLALFAAALDTRIDAVWCSGYVNSREKIWQEPIDRNVFGLLNDFGDDQLIQLALFHDTDVIIDTTRGPVIKAKTRGGAPYTLESPKHEDAEAVTKLIRVPSNGGKLQITDTGATRRGLQTLANLKLEHKEPPKLSVTNQQSREREARQIREIERYNQALLTESHYTRIKYFKDHDKANLEAHQKTIEPYRDRFRTEVIGQFDDPLHPARPRSRAVFDEENWTGYEVVLDVFENVFAYGILLMPKDIAEGERRPVVVCQHGLEGRPRNVIEKDHPAYHDYAAKLADRGFITFAPQNIYIFEDRFRTLQRKANPLGKTLFSVMVPQHQQIVDWLATLPQVDPDRIAFYGLSYGGKSAMRIPPLVDRYCLSICSADFNDWVWKNASTRTPYSYAWSGEYEIFEWDLGSTFNYAEMAALIAPKPFMVERGHFDGVAPDERVALEFAKVRNLYQAKLGIGDRCEIEFFVGPHTINGKGTFEFLRRHLNWPFRKPEAE